MRNSNKLLVIALLLGIVSCNGNKDCCLPNGESEGLIGKWQIYETGYSPGGGYIVKKVPDEPAQILNFESDNQFFSKNTGMERFSYYLILNDSLEGSILALYEEEPDIKENQDTKSLAHSYMIKYEEGNVKLFFRYCIEGCHIGLKKKE
jgi:hypothetical protein